MYQFTSESVSEGHPDKVADLISDRVADFLLKGDITNRAAIETLVTTNMVTIAGEHKSWGLEDDYKEIIEDIIQIQTDDIKIIIKTGSLEKKSKLRNYFEKNKNTIVVPFYEDTHQSLIAIAQKFFYEKKIKISNQNINFIVERVKGNRINLKNELEKIYSLSFKKNIIEFEEILKLTNLAENYSISELTDQCLVKNKKKTLNILNENNSSHEDNILIVKTFLYKLKRLKRLKKELQTKSNSEEVISSYKPPIFWKEKDLIKQQLKIWNLPQIQSAIKEVNNIEMLIKKNAEISNQIINDFILDRLN